VNELSKIDILKLKPDLYAVCARDKEILSLYNEPNLHLNSQLILNKITNKYSSLPALFGQRCSLPITEVPLIYNKCNENAKTWTKITKEGKIILSKGRCYSKRIQTQLQNIRMITTTVNALAALCGDGSIVISGNGNCAHGIPKPILNQLHNVKKIFSNDYAFAAILGNKHVITWGNENFGGKIPDEIQTQLRNIKTIFYTTQAFTALSLDGSVFSWGNKDAGGTIPDDIKFRLLNVKTIFSNDKSFIALLNNGNFFGWGNEDFGGKITDEIKKKLKNVKVIYSSCLSYAALTEDGSVIIWGCRMGHDITYPKFPESDKHITYPVLEILENKNVKKILPQTYGFMLICRDGEIIWWR